MKTCILTLLVLFSTNLFAAIEFSEDSTMDAQVEAVVDADEALPVEGPEPVEVGSPTMPVTTMPPMMQSQAPVGGAPMANGRAPRPTGMNGMGIGGMGMGMLGGGRGGGSVISDELAEDGDVTADTGDDLLEGFVCDVVAEDVDGAGEPDTDDVAEIVGAEGVVEGGSADAAADGGDAVAGAAVPEPAAIAVWSLLALCGLTFVRRRS